VIIIGVDPGLHTGISVVQVFETSEMPVRMLGSKVVDYTNHNERSVGRHLRDTVKGTLTDLGLYETEGGDDIRVVIERFIPEARKVDTTALEVIGEIRAAIRDDESWTEHIRHWEWPLRSEKDSVTGQVLRNLDLWVKGKELRHINDASRHIVTYLSKTGHTSVIRKGWPDHGQAQEA